MENKEEMTPRVKNPKRVEAGRKGALARKAKAAKAEAAKEIVNETKLEPEEITGITRDVESDKHVSDNHVNHKRDASTKQYIPIAAMLLGLLALGFYFRKEDIKEIPVKHVEESPSKQVKMDPFDF